MEYAKSLSAVPHLPGLSDALSLLPCRFLQVRPASIEDERLLVGIVTFLNAYFKQIPTEFTSDQRDQDLCWILELLLNQVQIIDTLWTSIKVKPAASVYCSA